MWRLFVVEVAGEELEQEGLLLVKPGRAPLLMDGVLFALFSCSHKVAP